jgi:hypothetical protein
VLFFVRILEAVIGEINVLYFYLLFCQMEQMVSRKSDRVICMGLKILKRKASGLKRIISK